MDIGIGTGKFGMLIREYTDIWFHRLNKPMWKTIIDGIEIFEIYRNPAWLFYSKIIIGDATKIIDELPKYDTIIMTEVLEHLPKNIGKILLNKCIKKSNIFLFSFTNCPQGAAFGNQNEKHISTWDVSDFDFKTTCLLETKITKLHKVTCSEISYY